MELERKWTPPEMAQFVLKENEEPNVASGSPTDVKLESYGLLLNEEAADKDDQADNEEPLMEVTQKRISEGNEAHKYPPKPFALSQVPDAEDEKETENRLKRLAKLLNQSEFFANFIAKKKEEGEAGAKKRGKAASKRDVYLSPRKRAKLATEARINKVTVEQLMKDKAILDARATRATTSAAKEDGEASGSQQKEDEVDSTKITPMGIEVSERQPFLFEGGCMRDYQLDGYEWLKLIYQNGVNGLLADEMGLGKTIQTIALVCNMIESRATGQCLIIAPLSTLGNWVSEFKTFSPRIPSVMYHGDQNTRIELRKELKKQHTVQCDGFKVKCLPVVVTSYEVAIKDSSHLQRGFKWEVVVLDEGHRIKNHECRLGREIRFFQSKFRLLLTGTPLQNNLQELWSLLNYLIPDVFVDLSAFENWFEVRDLGAEGTSREASNQKIIQREEKNQVISKVHKILEPFMLRRTKADVSLNLPPKKEILVFTPMSPEQKYLYKHILERTIHLKEVREKKLKQQQEENLRAINDPINQEPIAKRLRPNKNVNYFTMEHRNFKEFEECYNANLEAHCSAVTDSRSSFMNHCIEQGVITNINPNSVVIDLRKVVNHPYLIQMPLIPGTQEPLIDENLVNVAGKMLVLDAMLAKLKERGHKVLIFSQWTAVLDFIEDLVVMREYNYRRLDGSTKVMDRSERISEFNKDPKIFTFLLSTRAGGLGINLTAADTVIIYDSDWNPQCDLQAQDRCHRYGQTKPVVVYRLTCDGTIDRQMILRATGKRRLEKLIIKQGQFIGKKQREMKKLDDRGDCSAEELLKLLNSKDYSREVQSNGYVFTDEELDQLLDRSDMIAEMEGSPKKTKRAHDEVNAPSQHFQVV